MPDWHADVRRRLASLRLPAAREHEVVEELVQHLEERYNELLAAGTPPERAAELAREAFSSEDGLARRMAALRQARSRPPIAPGEPPAHVLSDLWQDARYAVRLMGRQPLFATVVIVTLTLGIAASTTMFSVVNGVLLKPLPYADAERLVWMFGAFRSSDSAAVSPLDFLDYRRQNERFERLAAMSIAPGSVTVSGGREPVRLRASTVSAGLITTLGVSPVLGRDFTMDDERSGSPSVIISHRLWQERFGGRRDVLGASIVVEDKACAVVGVLPAGFVLPYDSFVRLTEPVDLYQPVAFDHPEAQVRRFHWLRVIGRLKPGVTIDEAQAQMDVIARQLAATYPENDTWHLRLLPLYERIVGTVRPILLVLMSAVGLLLLVSCANVAGLLLARASVREHELALRGALGASRPRIVRQLLVEGLMLSLSASAVALVVTRWTVLWLKRAGPALFPRLEAVSVDPAVVAFALVAAIATTLVFALAPALHAARGDLAAALGPSRGATADRSRRLGQRTLVIGQLAVSVVLLSGAALLVRGFIQLVSIDTGFDAAGVMITPLPLPPERYGTNEKVDAFYTALLERFGATSLVEAAALGTSPPMAGANDTIVYREGRPPATARDQQFAQVRWIQGDYFRALGIPIVSGRPFDGRVDRAGAPDVAIISRRAAQTFFGNGNPLGRHLVVDLGGPLTVAVIAVTGDVRIFGQANDAPAIVYLHGRQRPMANMQVVIRSSAGMTDVAATLRGAVASIDPALPISRIDRMETLLADSVAQPRFAMLLIGSFAVLALVLTMVGLHGTLAYLVARRRREFGIRLAVGATRREVGRLVVRQAAGLVAIGVPLGLLGTFVAWPLAARYLSDQRPVDPIVVASVAVFLALSSLGAAILPATRAAGVEPVVALRDE